VLAHFARHQQDTLCLCEAVDYEVRRGYLKTGATSKLKVYENILKPQFQWIVITEDDWKQAAQFWADTANQVKALSDVDLIIAAVAKRLGGIIVTANADFNVLPVTRENWRNP
jgi:predicted nucleic acid-binding protein